MIITQYSKKSISKKIIQPQNFYDPIFTNSISFYSKTIDFSSQSRGINSKKSYNNIFVQFMAVLIMITSFLTIFYFYNLNIKVEEKKIQLEKLQKRYYHFQYKKLQSDVVVLSLNKNKESGQHIIAIVDPYHHLKKEADKLFIKYQNLQNRHFNYIPDLLKIVIISLLAFIILAACRLLYLGYN